MEIRNTQKNWLTVTEQVINDARINRIEVLMEDDDYTTTDTTMLRYYFPLAEWFYKNRNCRQLPLTVIIHGREAFYNHMLFRILEFTRLLRADRSIDITIRWNDSSQKLVNIPVPRTRRTGKLYPLCSVSGDPSFLMEPIQNDAGNSIFQCATVISIRDELLEYIKNEEKYVGFNGQTITSSFKAALRDRLLHYYRTYSQGIGLLAQTIWLYFLWTMVTSKQIFDISEGKIEGLREDLLIKSFLDAAAYGEGTYQLIENACLHSSGKRAWFGFRMHEVRNKNSTRELLRAGRVRLSLFDRFYECLTDGIPNENIEYYLEIFVLDTTDGSQGIVPTYNLATNQCPGSILEVINRPANDTDLTQHVQDLTVHYGLRVMQRIIQCSDGWRICRSPNPAGDNLLVNARETQGPCSRQTLVGTEWDILLPALCPWREGLRITSQEKPASKVADENPVTKVDNLFYFPWVKLKNTDFSQKETEVIERRNNILKALGAEQKAKGTLQISDLVRSVISNSIITMQIDTEKLHEIEVFSKALFSAIAFLCFNPSNKTQDSDKGQLRIALLFSDSTPMYTFVRLFSAFYVKDQQTDLEQQKDMENVQIALCVENEDGRSYRVSSILMGTSLYQTYVTARRFSYMGSDKPSSELPLYRYLTVAENIIEDVIPEDKNYPQPFHFDLFLTCSKNEATQTYTKDVVEKQINIQECIKDNWFVRQTKNVLERDMQGEKFGCKITDIHIRLGSKLHMDSFYEAELVFHDPENVSKFAYMIALDLFYGSTNLPDGSQVLLVGYEKYSSALTLELELCLKNSKRFAWVYSSIASYDEKGVLHLQMNRALEKCTIKGTVNVVTLLPVGSTLSTIYKMKRATTLYFAEKYGSALVRNINFSRNFSLILVNEALSRRTASLDEITSRYWDTLNNDSQIVSTKPEIGGGERVNVKYLIPLSAKWYAPDSCAICNRQRLAIRPVINAKQSDTMAGAIFHLRERKGGTFEDLISLHGKITVPQARKTNQERMDQLYGNLTYAHICEQNNHYQFYIDFAKYYTENKESIDLEIKSWSVDEDAYYVVVAPQQASNYEFVNAVLTNVFHRKARFLYLNLTDGFREELRTKFSYIANDFRRLRTVNPKAKFYVCFADATIVTGFTINRARVIMQTLLSQSEIVHEDIMLFHKVFLLVNRCSFNTISNYVQNPARDFRAYLYLSIPSYNTENDSCPACKLRERNELLEKRSSTERMSKSFHRRTERLKKRTQKEYQKWISEELLTNPTYYNWLRRWLYINADLTTELRSYCKSGMRHWYSRYAISHQLSVSGENNGDDIKDAAEKGIDSAKKEQLEAARYIIDVLSAFVEANNAIEIEARNKDEQNASSLEQESGAKEKQAHASRRMWFKQREITLTDLISFEKTMDPAKRYCLKTMFHSFKELLTTFIQVHLVAQHDFMRARSMHLSYEKLDNVPQRDIRSKEYPAYQAMLEIMESQMDSVPRSGRDKEFILARNIEWLVSFIKVLSREHLVNYYHFRHGIAAVMEDLRIVLEKGDKEDSSTENIKWGKIRSTILAVRDTDSALCSYLHFYVASVLFQQRASLRISSTVDAAELYTLLKSFVRAKDQYNKHLDRLAKDAEDHESEKGKRAADTLRRIRMFFSPFPGEAEIVEAYLKAAMNAAISTDDDSLSILMENTFKKIQAQIAGGSCHEPKMEKELSDCCKYLFLENTRILYAGLRDMESRFTAEEQGLLDKYRPAERFADYIADLNGIVNRCLVECYSNFDSEGKYEDILYQNRLGNFCRFWEISNGPIKVDKIDKGQPNIGSSINPITYLLQYYRCLNKIELTQKTNIDELPYLYEELCRTLCGLAHAKMCYFSYSNDSGFPEIFAQSGYYIPYVKNDKILSVERIDQLIQRSRSTWAETTETGVLPGSFLSDIENGDISEVSQEADQVFLLVNGASFIRSGMDSMQYIVIRIPLKHGNTGNNHFYILLQVEESKNGIDQNLQPIMTSIRNILCMRQKLQDVLSTDYTVLLNFRFDCSYIRPINKGTDSLSIVHISDLHAKESMRRSVAKITDKIFENTKDVHADLLAVTGDVADCVDASAPTLERNYRLAEEILTEAAICLWSEGRSTCPADMGKTFKDNSYLPHDWRRRVLITTGNHDYASMNQYKASLSRRSLSSGAPIETESGTMSKFAYFIDFMIRYLDPPIDELIRHDLNEVRNYRNLNLKVLLLNCSGKAMPGRTNKMAVNTTVAGSLLQREVWKNTKSKVFYKDHVFAQKPFRLCLAHYSPEYELSYFNDSYTMLDGWTWEASQQNTNPVNQLVKDYQRAVCCHILYDEQLLDEQFDPQQDNTATKAKEAFQTAFQHFCDAIDALEQGKSGKIGDVQKYLDTWDSTGDIIKDRTKRENLADKVRNNATYKDMKLYAEWLKDQADLNKQFHSNDERIAQIFSIVSDRIRMSKLDKRQFSDFVENMVQPYDLYLAGHIHSYAESPEKKVLVSDKLISDHSAQICGYVIKNICGEKIVHQKDNLEKTTAIESAAYSAQRFT